MPDKTIVLIRARTRSEHLHAKVLQPLAGKPAIVHVGERAGLLRDIADHAVFCIPEGGQDDGLADVLEKHFGDDEFYQISRGPEHNPLKRALKAINDLGADYVIEGLNGNAPLCYMGFVKPALQMLKGSDLDCVRYWNPECEWTMEHYACHAWPMHRSWWEKTMALKDPDQKCYREHPTLYFHWHPDKYNIGYLEDKKLFSLCNDLKGRAWSTRYDLDYPEDLVFLSAIYDALYDGKPVPLADAVAHVNANPHLRALNASRAESVGVYASDLQKRKWATSHARWRAPEGSRLVYCSSCLSYMGHVVPGGASLMTLGGNIIVSGKVRCACGVSRKWHRG